MKISEILLVVTFAVGLGLGQLLLKFSAQRQIVTNDSDWMHRLLSLVSDWSFLLGAFLYGVLLIYWIWLLTFLPLSRAYPFTILGFVVAGIGGSLFFDEPMTMHFLLGMAIIGIGLVVLSMG